MNWNKTSIFLFLISASLWSCFYSFKGVSIPAEIESFSVDFIENNASIVNPALSPMITNKLRDQFLRQTKLKMVGENGDYAFSGYISDYQVKAMGSSTTTGATQNQLSITVHIKLVSEKAPSNAFETNFTKTESFDASKNLSDVESELIETISDNLVQEIFNKSANNW
ncbi:MAG: LptE family protein [Flavobacteriales bacterium]|nr:LptE family protein [Flavobacteriales bacterium]